MSAALQDTDRTAVETTSYPLTSASLGVSSRYALTVSQGASVSALLAIRDDIVAPPGRGPSASYSPDEIRRQIDDIVREELGTDVAEGLRRIQAGEFHGTLLEVQVKSLLWLLE